VLYGKHLRQLRLQDLKQALNGWDDAETGDILAKRLHAKCGMHGTEIDRLACGEGWVKVLQGQGAITSTITFIHKSGRVHVQSVDAQRLMSPSNDAAESGEHRELSD
jgi:hypothetical protein